MTSQGLVGERIKTIRRQRGLSQAQLAHPELSDSYVSLIESGKRTPTPAVLELLAQKLDCSLTYLVNGVTAEQMEELELGLRFAALALENGDLEEARRLYAELLDNNNLAGLPALRQDAQYGYALATEACGNLPEAIAVLESLSRETGEAPAPERRTQIAVALCRCYREFGDFQSAVRVGESSLGPAVSRPQWTDALIELGSTLLLVYLERGDLLRARHFSAELLAAAEQLGSPRSIVAACWNAAIYAQIVGSYEEAKSLVERALAIQSENGDARNLARLRSQYAMLLFQVRPDDPLMVRELAKRALQELKESSAGKMSIARCELNIARTEMALGNAEEALDHARAARELLGDGGSSAVIGDTQIVLGQAYWMRRMDEESLAETESAVRTLDTLPTTRLIAENWQAAAETLARLGRHESSNVAFRRALACAGL
ncbi:helix-turn-helix domain-containing protein [Microbispora sp. RL4-1S]|uniref:Helix-turn-helix domain-containing protein n=1 Tax=Microbispora oryzae TaxID=2806554 RepID=A0A941AG60_9ACTN|nr:helix-turn-helix transcriptional regulator [Microbispora oryzae]MBP2702565.1 helix-turn-helix domain-containing protein [Microbispora oryzae]